MKTTQRATFKILFYLKKNAPKKDGSVPIMGRITINGKVAQFSTKLSIHPKKWDITYSRISGRSKEATEVNQKLDVIRVRINACYNRLLEYDNFVTAHRVKNAFLGIDTADNTLLVLYKKHNDEFEQQVGKTKSRTTFNKHNITFKYLQEFILYQYNLKDITFQELKESFITDFQKFLINRKNLKNNSVVVYLKSLKRIIGLAISKDLIHKNPFSRHKLSFEATDRAFLTEEELEHFSTVVLENKHRDFIRDLFVFCCFTGLSYIDLKNLKQDEIQRFWDKSLWIIKKRQKTNTRFSVRLLDTPLRIIEKYKGFADDDLVFNVPSHSSCIYNLEKIRQKAEIDKHITFHVSRHTCATLFLSKNVPIESVSKMLGHTNIRTTQIYARVTNKKISEDMERLANELKQIETGIASKSKLK